MKHQETFFRIPDQLLPGEASGKKAVSVVPFQARVHEEGPFLHIQAEVPELLATDLRIDASNDVVLLCFRINTADSPNSGELIVQAIELPEPGSISTLDAVLANGTLSITMLKANQDVWNDIPAKILN